MLVDAVKARLTERGFPRVEDAAQLQKLIQSNALPSAGASLFVVPMMFRGGSVRSASVPFIQDTEETIAVFIAVRDAQPQGDRAREALEPLIAGVIAAVAGWQAAGATDAFRLIRGSVLSFGQGVLLYQIDFATQSQLRIVS